MIYLGIRYKKLLYKFENYRYKLYPFISPNSSPSDVRQPIEGGLTLYISGSLSAFSGQRQPSSGLG